MKKVFLGLLLTLFLLQCAQRSGITGGPKDTSPPKLVRSNPDTFSTGFNSTSIRLDFDEFVKLDNVFKNLLITPVLREDPLVIASGKRVLIKQIDDSLWPNTTYVMEFNEAIQDITENNAAKGFRFVFSTGDYLDSLELSGQLKDAYTLKSIEDAFVFLYEDFYDSIPYKEKPRYIGRTDENGAFSIKNMKAGEYKVFMCTDNNKNYLYDRIGDKIDFLDKAIVIHPDSTPRVSGYLFIEDKGELALKSYGLINKWAFYMSFNKKVDSLDIEFIDKAHLDDKFRRSYNADGDSLVFWLTDSSAWSDQWDVIYDLHTGWRDTISIFHYDPKEPGDFKWSKNLSGKYLDLGENLELYFDFPLLKLDTSKIRLWSDSLIVPYGYSLNTTARKLIISADWKEEKSFRLVMDSAAFTDINGLSNDSLNLPFSNRKRTYYGTMEISLNGLKKNKGILMLLTPKGEVAEKVLIDGKESHFFEYLHPGEYLLKYIIDENGNDRWDAGDYLDRRHAEKVFIYQGSITIRSNWDQVIEWKFQ